MVSDLFFSQLALFALMWLCLILHWVWPSERVTPGSTAPAHTPPPRKRARPGCYRLRLNLGQNGPD